MADIVERLRKGIEWTGPTQDDTGQTENLMDEAADEIERLREWNREIALNAREFVAENERLRAALEWHASAANWLNPERESPRRTGAYRFLCRTVSIGRVMSEEIRHWSLGGYAPGDYSCKCCQCGVEFIGDKRAIDCLLCAAKTAAKAITALRAENERLSKDYQTARDAHDKLLAENERFKISLSDTVQQTQDQVSEITALRAEVAKERDCGQHYREEIGKLCAENERLRAALREMKEMAEFWIDKAAPERGCSQEQYETWLALGHRSKAMRLARAACLAMLKNWPGSDHLVAGEINDKPVIILPLPKEGA